MSLPPWLLYNFSPEEEGVEGMGASKEFRMGLGGGGGEGQANVKSQSEWKRRIYPAAATPSFKSPAYFYFLAPSQPPF